MSIQKRGSGYAVVHCHGPSKGKTIASHKTKSKALAQHRAIQANKSPLKAAARIAARRS